MGFIIHKYFLSKSLKAPPPSDSTNTKKKKKSTKSSVQQRRYSQPAGGSLGIAQPSAIDFLSVPDSAYAINSTPSYLAYNNVTAVAAARRRRNSMATLRRSSIAEGTMEDSMHSLSGSAASSSGKQSRRMSLQNDYMSPSGQEDFATYSQTDDYQNSFSSYYQLEDTKDDSPYGGGGGGGTNDWEESKRRPQRRFSTSSVSSSHSRDSTSVMMPPPNNSRVRQENKWLQLQLRQYQRHCSHLEAQLYGARDQLAYTNATWLDQLYDAQHKHQQEVFQTQRQAEQASNSILEQEMEELQRALTKVAQEEAKLEEKKKEISHHEEYDIKKLHSELKEWKERHAQTTANAKRIQDILEHEAKERDALLQETQRRVTWLEEQLQASIPNEDDDDDDYCPPISPHLVTLLQRRQTQLEKRIQDLLMENAHLQRGQSESYELQTQVKDLESALKNSQEQHTLYQTWHTRQMEHWKQETDKWKEQVQMLEHKLDQKLASREEIRTEYANQIEILETENIRLKSQLENRQKEWKHQSNLKDRTIESLQHQIIELGGKSSFPSTNTSNNDNNVALTSSIEPTNMIMEKQQTAISVAANRTFDVTMTPDDTMLDGVSSTSLSYSIPEGNMPKEQQIGRSGPKVTLIEEDETDLHYAQLREKELLRQISRLEESEANAQKQIQRAQEHIQLLEEILEEQNTCHNDIETTIQQHLENNSELFKKVADDDASIDQLLDTL